MAAHIRPRRRTGALERREAGRLADLAGDVVALSGALDRERAHVRELVERVAELTGEVAVLRGRLDACRERRER